MMFLKGQSQGTYYIPAAHAFNIIYTLQTKSESSVSTWDPADSLLIRQALTF